MMYGTYLKRKMPLYLVAGTACAVLVAANLWLMRENNLLVESAETVKRLQGKNDQIRLNTKRLQLLRKDLEKALPQLAEKQTARDQLLLAMDRMKSSMATPATFGDIKGAGEELTVSMDVSFPYRGFSGLLRTMDSLERQSYPFFRFASFSYERGGGGSQNFNVKGELVSHSVGGGP